MVYGMQNDRVLQGIRDSYGLPPWYSYMLAQTKNKEVK